MTTTKSRKTSVALTARGARRTDPLVDEAIVEIHQIWEGGLRDTVVRLGQYLIKTFYGSLDAARSQSPKKGDSLQALIARADELPVSVHALKMAVRVAVQYRELPRATAGALSATHHEKLLSVRDPALRLRLAEEAVRERLSAAQLATRVGRAQPPHAGGRPRRAPLERGMAAVIRALTSDDVTGGLAPTALRGLSREQLEALDVQARRGRELLEQIADAVASRLRA